MNTIRGLYYDTKIRIVIVGLFIFITANAVITWKDFQLVKYDHALKACLEMQNIGSIDNESTTIEYKVEENFNYINTNKSCNFSIFEII
jgi:hypothetical protein